MCVSVCVCVHVCMHACMCEYNIICVCSTLIFSIYQAQQMDNNVAFEAMNTNSSLVSFSSDSLISTPYVHLLPRAGNLLMYVTFLFTHKINCLQN